MFQKTKKSIENDKTTVGENHKEVLTKLKEDHQAVINNLDTEIATKKDALNTELANEINIQEEAHTIKQDEMDKRSAGIETAEKAHETQLKNIEDKVTTLEPLLIKEDSDAEPQWSSPFSGGGKKKYRRKLYKKKSKRFKRTNRTRKHKYKSRRN